MKSRTLGYPKEIPGASAYLLPHHELSGWPTHYLFGRGVIDFLNTYGHSLNVDREEVRKLTFDLYWYKGRVLLRSIPMQLDNDDEKELLLLIEQPATVHERFWASTIIPVNIATQNRLEIIPSDFDEEYTSGCRQVDITHDFNQDQQNELLFYCERAAAYSAISYQMVFSWNEVGVYRVGKTRSIWANEEQVEVEISDSNSDGIEEIVWREPCEPEFGQECSIVETFSWEDLTKNAQEYASIEFDFEDECNSVEDILCLNHLQTAVLSQTDPTVPEKITQLLTYLPADDPDAQSYIEHLTYLLGYFYELSGAEENAVNTYIDLIQRYPTSPWSWLAWARLEPVEN